MVVLHRVMHCIALRLRRAGGGDLWSEGEPNGAWRAAWRLKAAKVGVATARSPSHRPFSSLRLSRVKYLFLYSLYELPGDTAGERKGENYLLPVCHL